MENGPVPSIQTVNGTVTNPDSNVYIFAELEKTDVVENITVSIDGTIGTMSVYPQNPALLEPGTHTETISVRACNDSNCNSHISGSPKTLTVTYEVEPDPATIDSDGDGVPDIVDDFPDDPSETRDTDGDGTGNNADDDDDGDGVPDSEDAFPLDPNESSDLDGDGVGDNADEDRDGDGFSNDREEQAGSDPEDETSIPPELEVDEQVSLRFGDSEEDNVLSRPIAVDSNNGDNIAWSASVEAPWLALDVSAGSTDADAGLTVQLQVDRITPLSIGEHAAIVTFTADDPTVPSVQTEVVLSQEYPVIQFVAPYVVYEEDLGSGYVVVRGSGFSQLTQPILVGDQPAIDVEVRNDTELHVTPPALGESRYEIAIDDEYDIDLSDAELLVRAAPGFPDAAVPIEIGIVERTVYDEERELVFAAQCDLCTIGDNGTPATIYRFERQPGWTMTAHSYPGLYDISLTPDGGELLVLTTDRLLHVDPDTMETNKIVDLPFTVSATARQMAVMNDGQVLFIDNRRTYSLLDGTFGSFELFGDTVGIIVSADGSRAVTGDTNNPDSYPIRYYDASSDHWEQTNADVYFNGRGRLDRHADRAFLSNQFLDRNFDVIGEVPITSSAAGAISPDGSTLYSHAVSENLIRVVDVSGSPPFEESTPIEVPHTRVARMLTNHNGNLLFLVGEERFVVKNLSAP